MKPGPKPGPRCGQPMAWFGSRPPSRCGRPAGHNGIHRSAESYARRLKIGAARSHANRRAAAAAAAASSWSTTSAPRRARNYINA